jgi:hypothetical protein
MEFPNEMSVFIGLSSDHTLFTINKNLNIMNRLFVLILGLFLAQPIFSQDPIVFENTPDILTDSESGGPICKAFADVNGDYRDDIVRLSNATELLVDIQSNNGEFLQSIVIDTILGDSWTLSVADADNDGYNDILTAGNNNGMKVYRGGSNPDDFVQVFESERDFFAQASNFVDINNDGFLDAFVCDDDGHSEIFINDLNGGFIRDTAFIDMRTNPASDNSGNYGSEWTDIDGDGDLDLYIAKCRLGVMEDTDPRRINALFINDNGVYREAAAEFGLAIGEQTWTANFGDIDNDGDLDVFMVHHEFRSALYENINNERFEEIPLLNDGSFITNEAYQSSLADFNNDGFLDILIVGGGNRLLLNDQNKSFTSVNIPLGTFAATSFALGDANEDGFVDIMASYRSLGSGLNGDRDRMWINQGNDNHHVAVSLRGRNSNTSGVGAILKLFGDWGMQTRVVKAGVGYGITNSLTTRFGLGDATTIDSLVIAWPSGETTTYADLDIDTHFIANEGECLEELLTVQSTGSRLDCLSGEVTLSTSDMSSGLWSTGVTANSITVSEPGMYYVQTGNDACRNFGQVVIVRGTEELEEPKINLAGDVILCEGQEFDIALRSQDNIDWSTGEVSQSITISEDGQYFAFNQSACDSIGSESINVEFIDPSNITTTFETEFSQADTPVTLIVDEEEVTWYQDIAGTIPVASGSEYTTGNLSGDTIVYFDYTVSQQAPTYIGGADLDESSAFVRFEAPTVLGSLFFVVREPAIFRGFQVNSQVAGERRFVITNVLTQELVHEGIVNVGEGIQLVDLDFVMEPGSYQIQTDGAFSMNSIGTNNPQFTILEGDLDYPYNISDVATISRSLFGQNFYHYFFDWRMEPLIESCKTDIQEFSIDFNPGTATTETPESQGISIFPNPFSDNVVVQGNNDIEQISIYNNLNQLVRTVNPTGIKTTIDLSEIQQGHYIMAIQGKDFRVTQQLIKGK